MTSLFYIPLADVGRGITPFDGAKLIFKATGSDNDKDTFSDQAGLVPNANPVLADINGRFPEIWIEGSYKVILTDNDNVQQWEQDPVLSDTNPSPADYSELKALTGLSDKDLFFVLGADEEGDGGSGFFKFDVDSSAVDNNMTVLEPASGNGRLLREFSGAVNVLWKGLNADNSTDDHDDLEAILAEFDLIYAPGNTYLTKSTINRTRSALELFGDGKEQTVFSSDITDGTSLLKIGNGASIVSNSHIHDLSFSGKDIATGAGLEASDSSVLRIDRVDVEDFSQNKSTSRGMWFKGREFTTLHHIRIKDCVTGFYFDENPNAPTLDADVVAIDDCNFNISDTDDGIGIHFVATNNNAINITNAFFQVTKHAIRVNNSTATDSLSFSVKNMRVEQGQATQPAELAAHAKNALTLTANANNGETVTLGSKVYTWETSLTNVDGNVKIGADAEASINNLIAAINLAAGAGSTYAAATTAQPESVTSIKGLGDTMNVGAGDSGAHVATETMTSGSWFTSSLREQADCGYAIYFNQSSGSSFQDVTFENVRVANFNNGFFLRNITRCIIDNSAVNGGFAHESINADTSVKALQFRNFSREVNSLQTMTGLTKLEMSDANGSIEIWGPTSSPPKLNGSSFIKVGKPFLFPGDESSTISPGLTEVVEWSPCQIVLAGANMARTIPAEMQGMGMVQMTDGTSNVASASFSFSKTIGNADVDIQFSEISSGQVGNDTTGGEDLIIHGAGNVIRFLNNTAGTRKIHVWMMYASPDLS